MNIDNPREVAAILATRIAHQSDPDEQVRTLERTRDIVAEYGGTENYDEAIALVKHHIALCRHDPVCPAKVAA